MDRWALLRRDKPHPLLGHGSHVLSIKIKKKKYKRELPLWHKLTRELICKDKPTPKLALVQKSNTQATQRHFKCSNHKQYNNNPRMTGSTSFTVGIVRYLVGLFAVGFWATDGFSDSGSWFNSAHLRRKIKKKHSSHLKATSLLKTLELNPKGRTWSKVSC